MSSFPRRYTEIDTIRLNNISIRNNDNSIPPDGYILSASNGRAFMYNPLYALNSVPGLSDLQGQISTISTVLGEGGGGEGWADFPAVNNVNVNGNSIYSTNSQTYITANRTFYLDAVVLSNISTQAASAASGGAGDWSLFPAKTDVNAANYKINNVSSVRLINSDATGTLSVDYGLVYGLSTAGAQQGATLIPVSTATGQAFSTGQGLVPRVGALETFSGNQFTSNIRYDAVSTAFTGLSNNVYLLSTTLISTISTWTGTYAGSGGGGTTDPTLVGRVAALETFSTSQLTSNVRYDGVSTTLLTVSTATGQAFSTGQGLVPRVGALETFSGNQLTSNIRYDGVSTSFSTLSRGYFLLSTTLISTISTWTGTYAGPGGSASDPTLVGRVAALETFSTGQITSNVRYDGVSTAFSTLSRGYFLLSTTLISTISTWTGTYAGSGGGTTDPTLVGRVAALETFSTGQITSNVRYDGVSTSFSTLSRGYFLLSTTLISTISTWTGTYAGPGGSASDPTLPGRVTALETFSTNQTTSNIRYDAVSTALLTVSTTSGQAFSTGQGLVPRVGALETFSANQLTSNIRYDGVSTAFSTLSRGYFLLSTTLISTISTWTGTYAGSGGGTTDPTLVGRVAALETFSTSQSTMNNRYDLVSTAFTATSSATGQAFSTGQGLVPRVGGLETFSTNQVTSNVRYDGVSTALLTVSTVTGQAFSTGQGLVPRVGALETFSANQSTMNSRYDLVSTAFTATSSATGQTFSTGQGLVPRVGVLETFSANQLTSNIRYDGVSTALLTVSTATGQAFSTGQGLVPRVGALETFSTSQSILNSRYNFVSTAFTATSSATGQAFSTGQGLVPRVGVLETFSTNQFTSNIRYDGVSTALLTVSTVTGQAFSTGQGLMPRVGTLETFSGNQLTSNIRYDGVSTALLTVSTATGQAFSTGQGLMPRVGALETFITNQFTSNIRYDGVSTAFSTLSRSYFLLSTTLISTISTWTGTYAVSGGGGSDPTLVGRVGALETFSTNQYDSNIRYDAVSTQVTLTTSSFVQTSTNLSTLSYYVLSLVSYNILVRDQISTISTSLTTSSWANFPAVSTINAANNNLINVGNGRFVSSLIVGVGVASGRNTLANGCNVIASGINSHAEGIGTSSIGIGSHAEGLSSRAFGNYSHAEGAAVSSVGTYSHAEGRHTIAFGLYSHAEGNETQSMGNFSHVEGGRTIASGIASHAEGSNTNAIGDASHAEGYYVSSFGSYSHAEGERVVAVGNYSHAEGFYTRTNGTHSHAEGSDTNAAGNGSHAEGLGSIANGAYSHAEGGSDEGINPCIANGDFSHVEGIATTTSRNAYGSHAEGSYTKTDGLFSHAEGNATITNGTLSHAEGVRNVAQGYASHVAGSNCSTIGICSFAHGNAVNTTGDFSIGFGQSNEADANVSLVAGTHARGKVENSFTHACGGFSTIAAPAGTAQTAYLNLRTSTTPSVENALLYNQYSSITSSIRVNIADPVYYMNTVEFGLTGYETRRTVGATSAKGFYYGLYRFHMFWDEQATRVATIMDQNGTTSATSGGNITLTALQTTNALAAGTVTVKAYMVSNITGADYSLSVTSTGNNANWLAQVRIGDLMMSNIA